MYIELQSKGNALSLPSVHPILCVLFSNVLHTILKMVIFMFLVLHNVMSKCWTFFYRSQKFRRVDAFVGYQNDTPAAVVFHATHSMSVLQKQLKDGSVKHHFILELAHITAEIYVTKEEGSEAWCEAVSVYQYIHVHVISCINYLRYYC